MKNYYVIPLIAVLCLMLLIYDVREVFAIEFEYFNTTQDNDRSIVRMGNFVWVGGFNGVDPILTKMTLTGTISATVVYTAGTERFYAIAPNSAGSRLYGWAGTGVTSGDLVEIDIVNNAVLRSVATSCDEGSGIYFDTENDMLYCVTATETIRKFSFSTMSLVSSSTTMNAGANPCVDSVSITYNQQIDTVFATCDAPSRVVAVEAPFTSGTPDFAVTPTNPATIAYNPDQSNVLVSSDGTNPMLLFNYTSGVGFSASWQTYTTNPFSEQSTQNLVYDTDSNRYFAFDGGTGSVSGVIYIIDATTGELIFSTTSDGINTGSSGGIYVYSNSLMYGVLDGTTVATHDYFQFDMTGIPLGSNGEQDPTGTGLDCSLPENEFILTCRLGGDGSLGGAGTFIVGSVNGTTGLVPIMCSVGLVDCDANPDVATNGAGYLIVGIAIAVWVGVMWVASRGDLSSIPTFLWFIGALLIVGAFTVAGVIDVVFFIVTIIFVCALAAAKAKGLLGGGF